MHFEVFVEVAFAFCSMIANVATLLGDTIMLKLEKKIALDFDDGHLRYGHPFPQ